MHTLNTQLIGQLVFNWRIRVEGEFLVHNAGPPSQFHSIRGVNSGIHPFTIKQEIYLTFVRINKPVHCM